MVEKQILQTKPADPDTEKWHDFQLKEQQETPKRLEDTAKTLTGIISITLTLFLSVLKSDFYHSSGGITNWAIILWLIALLISFIACFPFRYRYAKDSTFGFRKAHKKVIQIKYLLLIISTVCYLVALIFLTVQFFF